MLGNKWYWAKVLPKRWSQLGLEGWDDGTHLGIEERRSGPRHGTGNRGIWRVNKAALIEAHCIECMLID